MKLKLFFLGMLAAAFLISCINDVIGPDADDPQGPDLREGLPVYASFGFNIDNGTGTYAGNNTGLVSVHEMGYTNAAMYIYSVTGPTAIAMNPEAAVYISDFARTGTNPFNMKITMKTTSGHKRIFVGLNVNQGGTNNLMPLAGAAYTIPATNPGYWNTSFNDLNNVLSATATGWQVGKPTGTNTHRADGLIRGLAKGMIFGNNIGVYDVASPDMLMTNWSGPDDVATGTGGSTFNGTNYFFLAASIDSIKSNTGTVVPGATKNDDNIFYVNVQRAFAKVTVLITASQNTNLSRPDATFSNKYYNAGVPAVGNVGTFQPWNKAGTTVPQSDSVIWTLGNIHKETKPFQSYPDGVNVRDHNYMETNDSIKFFDMWRTHYDNERVFNFSGANSYPSSTITVVNTKDKMRCVAQADANNSTFLPAPPGGGTYWAYTTENARGANPAITHDFGTYIVIGGRYIPALTLTDIQRDAVETNPPHYTWTANYTTTNINDTIFYIPKWRVFIYSRANVLRYMAWAQKMHQTALQDLSNLNTSVYVEYNRMVYDPLDPKNPEIYRYAGGQCFYRVFIQDMAAPVTANRPTVRRNHQYAVYIQNILGPGIDNPNKILIPDEPITPLDTYVTAYVRILDWHLVEQFTDIDIN